MILSNKKMSVTKLLLEFFINQYMSDFIIQNIFYKFINEITRKSRYRVCLHSSLPFVFIYRYKFPFQSLLSFHNQIPSGFG